MRIAFFVDAFPVISETFILNQITGLIDRGHSVDVFARNHRHDARVHADIERYGLLDRTRYLDAGGSRLQRIAAAARLLCSRCVVHARRLGACWPTSSATTAERRHSTRSASFRLRRAHSRSAPTTSSTASTARWAERCFGLRTLAWFAGPL